MKTYSKNDNDRFFKKLLKERFNSIDGSDMIKDDYENFTVNQSCSESIKEALIKKYDNLACTSNGFIDRFGGLTLKQAFIKNYFNGVQPRCCFCGQLLEVTTNNNGQKYIIADIEHILPKSKFPQLALNSNNWAPCCKECNQAIKGDKFFAENPLESFKGAIEDLRFDYNNLHPLQLWKAIKITPHLKISYSLKLTPIAEELLGFYGIPQRAKILFGRSYDILFSILKHSDIRSPESLERLLENMASSNWHEVNDGYSLNNSPQIWQEFIEHILYDENNLLALWEEVKDYSRQISSFSH